MKFPHADGFRHPVVLHGDLNKLMPVPCTAAVRRMKPPRRVMLGTFYCGYGFFHIMIAHFRAYRIEWLGLPPAQ